MGMAQGLPTDTTVATNRRNHYRILHVQPDASADVIRACYRTLVQTLKQHPDLGGDHWQATLINGAYAVLRDPARRAEYDRTLPSKRDMAAHCYGPALSAGLNARRERPSPPGERRNCYRVLQVQPDAPVPVLEASHRVLLARGDGLPGSVAHAFATLCDARSRQEYDRTIGFVRAETVVPEPPPPEFYLQAAQGRAYRRSPYDPTVQRSCMFCGTPNRARVVDLRESGCLSCGSPLLPPASDSPIRARRGWTRSPQDEQLGFFTSWPGRRYAGRLLDLSPMGLRVLTKHACDPGTVVKIESDRLHAVGVVVRRHDGANGTVIGVRFLTVAFRASGSFVSARA